MQKTSPLSFLIDNGTHCHSCDIIFIIKRMPDIFAVYGSNPNRTLNTLKVLLRIKAELLEMQNLSMNVSLTLQRVGINISLDKHAAVSTACFVSAVDFHREEVVL